MSLDLRMQLATEIRKILQTPEMKDRFAALGIEPAGLLPDEFTEFLKKQNDRYALIAKQANLKAD